MPGLIIDRAPNLVIAMDMAPIDYQPIVQALGKTALIGDFIGGVKIGVELACAKQIGGLGEAVDIAINYLPNASTIIDLQRSGYAGLNDAKRFGRLLKHGHPDAAVVFPFMSPNIFENCVKEAQAAVKKGVIVGIEPPRMPDANNAYFKINQVSYRRMLEDAIRFGVRDFLVPGDELITVEYYRKLFEKLIGIGRFALYADGFVKSGGAISKAGKAAGNDWHAIIGRGIIDKSDPARAASFYSREMRHKSASLDIVNDQPLGDYK